MGFPHKILKVLRYNSLGEQGTPLRSGSSFVENLQSFLSSGVAPHAAISGLPYLKLRIGYACSNRFAMRPTCINRLTPSPPTRLQSAPSTQLRCPRNTHSVTIAKPLDPYGESPRGEPVTKPQSPLDHTCRRSNLLGCPSLGQLSHASSLRRAHGGMASAPTD